MLSGMRTIPRSLAALPLLGLLLAASAAGGRAGEATDPLAAEIERWSEFLQQNSSKDQLWTQIKDGAQPVLARAEEAQRDGRRLLALLRLAFARADLAAAAYVLERPTAERKEAAGFEAEWARMGSELREAMGAPSPGALEGVRPAAVRAMGEAALPQVRILYEASLEYGRNTMPEYGLYYLGSAKAQREFAAFCRRLSGSGSAPEPPLRALRAELDRLEAEFLAAYRPPASVERHREFIGASSALKEARELDAAGLRHGALLRYLQAAQRFAPLRAAPALDAPALRRELGAFEARLASGGLDHSIGRLFLEIAQAELAGADAAQGATAASAIAGDVLPRYFAALEPASPETPRPEPRVTVTLVRWPYT
jgi:hypothetical protein